MIVARSLEGIPIDRTGGGFVIVARGLVLVLRLPGSSEHVAPGSLGDEGPCRAVFVCP